MKKITGIVLSIILMISAFIIPSYEEYGATPAISMSVSSTSVIIGNEITATIKVPDGYSANVDIRFSSGTLSYVKASASDINVSNGNLNVNMYKDTATITVTFKAISSGTATIEVVPLVPTDLNTLDIVQMAGASTSITIANEAVPEPTKSNDNSLASLKLSNGTLSPAFKYNKTEYTATVDYNVTSIVVDAKTSNAKAVIESLTGNENLKVGENTITIVVKAENGQKATYKIVVTRKAQGTGGEEPGNTTTEPNTETNIEGINSGLSLNGEALLLTATIPAEVIPADFTMENMMLNNKEIPCLNFNNGNLTVLYLKNAKDQGELYVYDKDEQNVYPFIRLQSNNRYVIVLQPEVLSAPEGYEMFSISIEGKVVVTAWRYVGTVSASSLFDFGPETYYAAEISDFYLLYCLNNEGEYGWYQYDSVEGTFQRYAGTLPGGNTTGSDEIGGDASDSTEDGSAGELEALLKEEQNKNLKLICIFVFVVAVLLVVIINLILFRRKKDDDFDEEDFDEE